MLATKVKTAQQAGGVYRNGSKVAASDCACQASRDAMCWQGKGTNGLQ
jgi:hypothetical protein